VSRADLNQALRDQGFHPSLVTGEDRRAVQEVFVQTPDHAKTVVADLTPCIGPSCDGATVDRVTLAGFIFGSAGEASCENANVIGVCVKKRNVVLVVRKDHEAAAREALDGLG
jgi:hypothetical protein